jgi:hypothetical protein
LREGLLFLMENWYIENNYVEDVATQELRPVEIYLPRVYGWRAIDLK